jgi:polysaccharide biosynthesis protein PslG
MQRDSRYRRALVAGLAAAMALTWMATVPRSRAEAATTSKAFAIGSQQPGIAFESPTLRNSDLATMAAAGMTWVRADFFWSTIQAGGRGSFAWAQTDAFVRAATAHHLHVLALVDYAPAWARSSSADHAAPRDPRDYATFVHAAAVRYAPMGVHAWEIWNEPNLSMFWSPKADPAAYAALLKLAYPAIKSADRYAAVVTGGLSPATDGSRDLSPKTFLTDLYTDGARGSFDAVGYHPYSYPYAPMYPAAWNTFYETPAFHAVMTKYGDGAKRVWGTEFGFPTGTNSKAVGVNQQASDLVDAIRQWKAWTFTGPIIVFTVRDASSDQTNLDANMGMLYVNRVQKPAFGAIRSVANT